MNEFDLIKNIKKKHSLSYVGDDCAVLPTGGADDLLLTTDLLVEGVDFELLWATAEQIGYRALAVSVSDIAAMGGEPKWAMASIGIPERLWQTGFPQAFFDGWNEFGKPWGIELVGGDISRSPGPFFVDSIVSGTVPTGRAIRRSGARAGDSIFVSGPLGSSAAGLSLLKAGKTGNQYADLIRKQLRPAPQVVLGKHLRELELATAMIDLSDGLSSDLSHICRESVVGAVIFADQLPFEGSAMDVAGSVEAMLDLMLNGGEDFELLFTGDRSKIEKSPVSELFRIGEITASSGVIEIERNGIRELLTPRGFSHF